MTAIQTFYARHARLALAVTLGLLVGLAYANRFIQDDAYISFRYAQHLAQGDGLVWNVGEPPVEGYTNFLWTVLLAVPETLGLDPVAFANGVGLLCFVGALLATYALARQFFARRALALLAVIVLGTNLTFSHYATGGLETMLQALLMTAALALLIGLWTARRWPLRGLAGLSVLLALAVMTHPELGPAGDRRRTDRAGLQPACRRESPRSPAAGGGPGRPGGADRRGVGRLEASLLRRPAAQLAVRQGGRGAAPRPGAVLRPGVPVCQPAAADRAGGAGVPPPPGCAALGTPGRGGLWLGYVVRIGGDFMEFRFMVPILPVLAVQGVGVLFEGVPWPPVRLALLAVVLAGPLFFSQTFPAMPRYFIETVDELEAHLTAPWQNWLGVGAALGEAFAGEGGVTIATTAAGAIPYKSGLRTVDMLGLNDRWIALNGVPVGYKPGHQRYAPLGYLEAQGVALVIGHPILESATFDPLDEYRAAFLLENFYLDGPAGTVPADAARMVRIPIADGYVLLALLLTPDPAVEATIAREGWEVVPAADYCDRWVAVAEAGES